ncbi:MAG: sigma factor-like helix-turn-helix DNA-binding protein [Patescibacteria group bacterium]|jgi:DNA-directed RNA polymerase sigma subunit (sigma70/sigma32)
MAVESAYNQILNEQLVCVIKNFFIKKKCTKWYEVIKYRFGLEGEKPHTFKECSVIFGVSKERIRQITIKAIRVIREDAKIVKILREFL